MIVPDVNLLLYAYFTAFPLHGRARVWWEAVLGERREVGLPGPVVFGFLRIATNGRVFDPPMTVERALGHVDGWVARPHVRLLPPGPRHLEIAGRLLREAGTAADLTTDVQIAALALEHGAEVCSNDTDFARFAGLRWSNPLR